MAWHRPAALSQLMVCDPALEGRHNQLWSAPRQFRSRPGGDVAPAGDWHATDHRAVVATVPRTGSKVLMAVCLYRGAVRAGNAPLGLAVAAPVERRVRQLLRRGGAGVTPVTPTPDARSRPGQSRVRAKVQRRDCQAGTVGPGSCAGSYCRVSCEPSCETDTRTWPPLARRPNSSSSASGRLMCSWMVRAIGRAPIFGS